MSVCVCLFVPLPGTHFESAHNMVKYHSFHLYLIIKQFIFFSVLLDIKKSRIRETKNLSTDADSRTDTVLERLRDL